MENPRYNPAYRTVIAPTAVYLATMTFAAELAGVDADPLPCGSIGELLDSALAYSRRQSYGTREDCVQEATMAMLAGGAVLRLCAPERRDLDSFNDYYQDLLEAIPADCPDEGLVLQLDC